MGSDPKEILATWETWGCGLRAPPRVIDELAGGQTNHSYLLDADGRNMVLRINAPADSRPGIDRDREALIWNAASEAGIAPNILHADPERRCIVTEYLDGAPPEARSAGDLFDLLANAHNLAVEIPSLDYSLYIAAYWAEIEARPTLHNAALNERRQPMQSLLEDLIDAAPAVGLCHHDPVPSNVISMNGRLYLLDWEYATRGYVAMDYAVLSIDWNIADAEIVERTNVDPAELDMAKQLYAYICDLWQEIT